MLLLPVAFYVGSSVVGLTSERSDGEGLTLVWITIIALGAIIIASTIYMLVGRAWAYYATVVLSLPTVIVPVLLLLGLRGYMDYADYVQSIRDKVRVMTNI